MDQFTPDAVDADRRALAEEGAEVPALVAWALNHDLPGGSGESEEPAADPGWLGTFPSPTVEEEVHQKRDWRPFAIGGAIAASLTLLGVWLLGGFDQGEAVTAPPDADVVEVREIVAEGGSTSAAAVGRKVTPSVVTVEVGGSGVDGDFQEAGLGSGVVFTEDGYIVTNHHVVEEATRIKVVVEDGTSYEAELIGSDARTDIAVLWVEAAGLTPIELGSTDDLAIGDVAIAVGNPLGLSGGASLTVGVLSAFEREVTTADSGTLFGMLQTDAPITRGSSGGALVDGSGRLIGITTAIGVSSAGAEGIGFAVPVEVVDRIATELIEIGTVRHAFLGVRLENHQEEQDGGGSRPAGARVVSFPEGVDSAAAGAGLRVDDIIVAVDGVSITTRDDLISALRRKLVEDTVVLDVVRDGQQLSFEVVLGERPDDL